jgi:hypothetical protein
MRRPTVAGKVSSPRRRARRPREGHMTRSTAENRAAAALATLLRRWPTGPVPGVSSPARDRRRLLQRGARELRKRRTRCAAWSSPTTVSRCPMQRGSMASCRGGAGTRRCGSPTARCCGSTHQITRGFGKWSLARSGRKQRGHLTAPIATLVGRALDRLAVAGADGRPVGLQATVSYRVALGVIGELLRIPDDVGTALREPTAKPCRVLEPVLDYLSSWDGCSRDFPSWRRSVRRYGAPG